MPLQTKWPDDPYEFLVLKKFGAHTGPNPLIAHLAGLKILPENVEAANQYRAELKALPIKEINQMVQAIVYPERDQLKEEIEKSDDLAFFNQPHAEPDYKYWFDKGNWHLSEAAAISLGKCPYVVNPEALEPFRRRSFFVEKFVERELLLADTCAKFVLYGSIAPRDFVRWALNTGLEIPRELTDCLPQNERTEDRQSSSKDTLTTRERESLLKMILAMAIGGYGHAPLRSRSPTAGDIENDLHKIGLSLDQDTIRKYLKEAANCHYISSDEDRE